MSDMYLGFKRELSERKKKVIKEMRNACWCAVHTTLGSRVITAKSQSDWKNQTLEL